MAQKTEPRLFFDEKDTLERVLFVYGHTEDSFCLGGTMYNSMEYMLERHLIRLGYDLVLFYNGVQQLYCFTQSMADKRDELFREMAENERQRNSAVQMDIQSLLGSTGAAEETGPAAEAAPLRLRIDDLEIATFADSVMRRTDIRSAIVFSDGWDLIEETEQTRTLANRFRSWYHLGANNRNIAIICFPTLIKDRVETSRGFRDRWGFLRDKIISGNGFSDAVKYISIPRADEIEARLRLESAYPRLSAEERKNAVGSAQRKLHELGNTLKGLDSYLRIGGESALRLLAQNDGDDDKRSLEILKNTRGWEAVAEAVERIANSVSLADMPTADEHVEGTIARMTEQGSFLPSGVCINLVLKGNPGTGKTTIAEHLGRIYRMLGLLPSGHVVKCARDDLVGRYVGHTAANTRAKIEEAMGGILFIDEAYTLYRRRDENSNDFGIEAIDTLIEAMTRSVGSFAVVMAGYPAEMDHMLDANPGMRSRFGQNIITIEDYPPELLRDISVDYMDQRYGRTGLHFDETLFEPGTSGNRPIDVFFKGWFEARNRRQFGNARDCRSLVDAIADSASKRGASSAGREDFPEKVRGFFKEADLDIDSVLASLDDIVGQNEVKEKLLELVTRVRMRNTQAQLRPDIFKNGVAPGHYLFCGNPGTGKSTVAEKFAQVLGALRVIGRFEPTRITGAMLVREMERSGIEGARKIIEDARGGVLFVDEAHQLVNVRFALQLLLDPMIELKNELCIILACYESERGEILRAEPGLESRLTCEFRFADYDADELTEIFKKKALKAGYTLAEGTEQAVWNWMETRRTTDAESRNGRYAEQLMTVVEGSIADRFARGGYRDEEMLFTVLPEDIR